MRHSGIFARQIDDSLEFWAIGEDILAGEGRVPLIPRNQTKIPKNSDYRDRRSRKSRNRQIHGGNLHIGTILV
jgi:hypothetical protein